MKGKIQVMEGVYPITTLNAVMVGDGTNKTLKDMIDNGEISGGGANINITGRACVNFLLRGAKIYADFKIENSATISTLKYSFPTGDTDRLRRLFVKTPAGTLLTIDMQDGELLSHEGIVYNLTNNTIEKRTGTWGGIPCTKDEYVLLYNCLGFLSGELACYVDYRYNQNNIFAKNVHAELISATGSTQGIMIIDNVVYTSYHATDDHSLYDGRLGVKTHNICHMNAMDYNNVKDVFIVGNGSKDYFLPMKGWIFKNWKSTFEINSQLDINVLDKVELDFSQFTGEYKAQLCWGDYNTDIVYLLTSDNRIIRELQLNKNGTEYDGTYTVLKTYYTNTSDIMGGFLYYNGCLYTGVKGEFGIRKMKLCSNGYIENEYLKPIGKVGDMQGIAISNGFMYAYTDSKGYKINIADI